MEKYQLSTRLSAIRASFGLALQCGGEEVEKGIRVTRIRVVLSFTAALLSLGNIKYVTFDRSKQ